MKIIEYAITDLRSLQAVAKILHAQKQPYVVVPFGAWQSFYQEFGGRGNNEKWYKFCDGLDALPCEPDGTRCDKGAKVNYDYVSIKVLEKYDV